MVLVLSYKNDTNKECNQRIKKEALVARRRTLSTKAHSQWRRRRQHHGRLDGDDVAGRRSGQGRRKKGASRKGSRGANALHVRDTNVDPLPALAMAGHAADEEVVTLPLDEDGVVAGGVSHNRRCCIA